MVNVADGWRETGSYFPKPVKAVSIPKKNGGTRILGIPTVEDRIAQMVVKLYFEPNVEPIFYEDSYGYRPNKSEIQAIEVTRTSGTPQGGLCRARHNPPYDEINVMPS